MSLLVVGLSHRSAPVSVLERASLNADAQLKLLQDTVAAEPAAEAAVLATCNRIELYADVDKFHAGVAELSTLLAQHSGVGLEELTPYLYVHYEDRAVHHLFSVACGLDSMVVGEGQILGQIKDSLARAQDLHTAGRLLNDLFQQALRVGKRAHSETGIDRAGQSLVTFGLEQLSAGADVEQWARGKKALVIGAGSMSSLAAATLARAGVAEIVVANRTFERAERLALLLEEQYGQRLSEGDDTDVLARAVPMDAVPGELTRADVAVSCTGATGLVLTADSVAATVEGRTGAPAVEDTAVQETAVREAGETPLPGAGSAADENCPLDLSSVSSVPSGFSVMGEAAAEPCPTSIRSFCTPNRESRGRSGRMLGLGYFGEGIHGVDGWRHQPDSPGRRTRHQRPQCLRTRLGSLSTRNPDRPRLPRLRDRHRGGIPQRHFPCDPPP